MVSKLIRANLDPDVDWAEIEDVPEAFPPEAHEHNWTTDILDTPEVFPPEAHEHTWEEITGEPDFAPALHTHSQYSPTDHAHSQYSPTDHTHSQYSPTAHTHSEYAPENHTHPITQVTGFRTEQVANFDLNAQQNSGFYGADSATGRPAGLTGGHYLIIRRPSSQNNYQFQIGANINAPDDVYYRVFGSPSNPATPEDWYKIVGQKSGTWTAVLTGSTGAGAFNYTGGKQVGRFVKQGSIVRVEFNLQGSFSVAPTGEVRITGLPFTPSTNADYEASAAVNAADVGWEGVSAQQLFIIKGNTNYIGLFQKPAFAPLAINWSSRGLTSFIFKGAIEYQV